MNQFDGIAPVTDHTVYLSLSHTHTHTHTHRWSRWDNYLVDEKRNILRETASVFTALSLIASWNGLLTLNESTLCAWEQKLYCLDFAAFSACECLGRTIERERERERVCVCARSCVCLAHVYAWMRERERDGEAWFLLVSVCCAGMCASIVSELNNKVPSYF